MSAGIVRRPIVRAGNQSCKPTGFSRGYLTVKTREEAERFLALLVGKRKEEAEQRKKYLENLERKLEGEAVVGRKVHEWHS